MMPRLRWLAGLDAGGNPEATVLRGEEMIGWIHMVPAQARGEHGARWLGQGIRGGITALHHSAAGASAALAGGQWLVPPAILEVRDHD